MERQPVDIIIPIYNAYMDLISCINSVKQHTDLSYDRLILINDCSPDEHIVPYLETVKEHNVLVIHNEKNKGFSGNVNLGMDISADRDVILLNSDTVVTANWVNKIVSCAYSAEEIGTVTPLSNSATLCSVPVMCQDNKIPDGFTIDEYAALIEACSLKKYPRITVAVGFCMFIKRKVIEDVGYFDAETFERGYGEENDFCNRAEQLGYIHVMCDDTFIYHKGTVSFVNEEKQRLIDAHDRILQERYPAQMRRNHLYCINNPEQYIRDNINFYSALRNGKKNLLYLVHFDFREDGDNSVGGTQLHVRDLVQGFKESYNVYVMARVQNRLRLSIYANNDVETLEFLIGEMGDFPQMRDKKQLEIYRNVLRAFQIQLVHVHHTHGLTFDLFYAAEELQIPVYLTLHDFYYICPNEKLLIENKDFCCGKTDQAKCEKCLKQKFGIAQTVPFLKKWRKECLNLLIKCRQLIVPSNSTKEIYSMYYPEIADKIQVIYHGTEFEQKERLDLSKKKISKDARIHCSWDFIFSYKEDSNAIIGWCIMEGVPSSDVEIYVELTDWKKKRVYAKVKRQIRMDVCEVFGSDMYKQSGFRATPMRGILSEGNISIRVIMEHDGSYYTDECPVSYNLQKVVLQKKNFNVAFVGGMVEAKGSALAYDMITSASENINWFVMGNIGDQKLAKLEQKNLFKTGGYEKDDLPLLFKSYKIDLVCVLSIWPETFCYTISEALLCGIPVLVTDIGAMGERIRQNECGWIVKRDSTVREIVEKIQDIAQDGSGYKDVKKRVENLQHKSIKEMIQDYENIYQFLNEKRELSFNSAFLLNGMIRK